jgi:hypothetical protein
LRCCSKASANACKRRLLSHVLMLFVKFHKVHVVVTDHVAAPLLHAHVIVAVVEGVQVCASSSAKLETDLRVAQEVAILFAVVRDRDSGESQGA